MCGTVGERERESIRGTDGGGREFGSKERVGPRWNKRRRGKK